MRLNSNTPYQAQQQLHQQQQQQQQLAPPLPSSASLQQQRHQQQPLHHNPTSQQQTTSGVPPPRNNMLGGFNSNQQQNSWSTQQQPQTGYLPSTKMMQSTPPPPAAGVPVPTANSWPQQQPTQQQNYQNVNMYQQTQLNTAATQPPPTVTQQQWPQNSQQSVTYDNYYQQQPAANNNNMFQQPQQSQTVAAPSPVTFFQQQPAPATQNPVNFFDTTNNNQANNAGDGWDDWGWNDNNTIATETTQLKEETNTQNIAPVTANQTSAYNSSIIADSFNSQNNNDAWNWGTSGGGNDNEPQLKATKETQNLDNQTVTQNDNWNWPANANDNDKLQQQQQQQQIPNSSAAVSNEQHNDNWNHQTTTTNENQQHLAKTVSTPPPPPPTEFSTSSSSNLENHNYNTNAAASTSPGNSNIPNTVFVSQAKPVTLPSRQFASPPGGNTPVTEHPPETALMPPQAFQNVEDHTIRPNAIQSPALQPPNVATPPPPLSSSIQPPAGPPPANNAASGNPFKRSGAAQHHRASNLMTTASAAAPPLAAPNVFSMAPPPPADFANPTSVSLLEPDNNELPSQENQEVLLPPNNNITLPNPATQPPPPSSSITLPNSNVGAPTQPLNDERNQYLQTSHLSENSEEQQQPETDGLLPPPGLSRLVLGEPELEASQQRMVMGTEAPQQDNAVTQAAVMHLEERHADGEDTASDNAVTVTSLAGQAAPPSTSAPTSDRNLYLVPGESNNTSNNQQPQRVVTGVELAEQREIDMDGENLEDEQIQQQQHHQQQQQQQHHQHHHPQHHQHATQNQHPHTALSPEARNEPPVEGADDNVAATPAIVTPVNTTHSVDQHQDHHTQHHHHHSSNQLAKSKDTNTISSPNDDDDSDDRLLNERVQSTAGSSKSRSKYENDRLTVPSSRRRDKRSSVERYESDEYLNSEGEYSSEREERERRERDRRRNYREGSVRSDRGVNDEDEKRSRRHRGSSKRDKYYYGDEERSRGGASGGRDDRERDRTGERSKAERRRQRGYDNDSRYETEESTRFESRKDPARRSMRRSDRSDQGNDYDDYNRRSGYRSSKRAPDNYESDRRDRRRSDKHREPRYRDDPRYDPREYEDYRKHSSRNARESDMEKEAAGASTRSGRMHHDPRHAAMYGYPSGGYYDPYTYYYQQMARTNPQAYADWYKKYYGQAAVSGVVGQSAVLPGAGATTDTSLPATANDGRESVHSGRSSAHNDMKDRSGALSARDPDPVALEPQRLTPCKFINEHTVVSFASGILVTVKPKYTPNGSISNIVKLLKFKPNDETRKLFKVFPGPLVRGLTHKKTVIEFCHEQIRLGPMETTIYAKQLISNNADKYRASYTLMWNLLILLLKQNGMVVGTDIAELLLKNQQQYPYQTPSSTANNSLKSKSGSASPIEEELELTKETAEENPDPLNQADNAEPESLTNDKDSTAAAVVTADQDDTEDNSLTKSSSNSNTLSEDEITEKFRNYLLYGNVNEALEWATDNNLWGHALFLASKLDRRSHANVMMKFANKLSLNDPLQTLYQLMSGRTPSSVTCVQDEKWGDWRPHLSMILSNTSQKPELDRKAITTLGDSLFNRGDLYAAHFCYLMAQVGFGRYQESATHETSLQQHLPKLVLLGSSHYKQFQEFAHNEAIVMTEIYEYACSLNDEKFSIVEFQPYKFLLATRLLDYGFHLKSLMYLEQIAVHIARDPTKYESSFITKVYELADRLKYYDPVLEKTIDDQQPGSDEGNSLNLTPQQMEEQKWLQNLRQLAQQYKQDFNTTNNLQAAGSLQDNQYQQSTLEPNYYNQQQQQIDQQFMEINKQFSELNLQYQQPTTGNVEPQQQQQPMFYNPEQQQQLSEQQVLDPYQQQQQQQQTAQQQSLPNELPLQNAKDLQQTSGVEDHQQQDLYQQQQYLQSGDGQQQTATGYTSGYYDPSQYNAVDSAGNSNLDAANPSYDYWGQQQQPTLAHMGEENARPTISMPKSKTYDTDDEGSNNKQQQQPTTGNEAQKKQQAQQQQQKSGKKEDKDANKNQQQSNQNSGWFGGIWNKFSLKPKNQMILPDDKNPSIVWDPEKKKWVNTDGDEDEQESLKPPPKMSDLMPQQQQQQPPTTQQQAPTNQIPFMDPQQMSQQSTQFVPSSMPQSAPSPNPLQQQQQQNQPQQPAPAKTPTLQSNMFKMQRNRTLKNAYVDVFNPSGAPVNKAAENILAPALPPAAVPQGGFFIPGGSTSQTADNSSQQQDQYQQQPQQQNTPQFYNPNQFTSGTGY